MKFMANLTALIQILVLIKPLVGIDWNAYKSQFGKTYATTNEENNRLKFK
jgi:hypothetical protein